MKTYEFNLTLTGGTRERVTVKADNLGDAIERLPACVTWDLTVTVGHTTWTK